ncbi:MAG TPA: hypothetical protein VGM73_05125 [Candidatus Didemnitutus sp.]
MLAPEMNGRTSNPAAGFFRWGLVAAVAAFAWLRFSDNIADNDLWGHVLYGERNLAAGAIERTDPFSWTATGQPWINHEVLAEIALGGAHRVGGATGLWLLMIALSAATVLWALRQGAAGDTDQRWAAVLLLGASVNFIALGCAARPQLFTLLALVALFSALRGFFGGRLAAGSMLPPLFALWANAHGGFLAGLLVLVVAAVSEIALLVVPRLAGAIPFAPPSWRPGWMRIAATTVISILAVALNPWGLGLLRWTIASVALARPHITEWQPMALNAGNAAFFIVLVLSAAGWIVSRRPRRLWEAAALALLAAMAVASRRHAPLFGLANLILTPRHLADAFDRIRGRIASLRRLAVQPAFQWVTGIALAAAAISSVRASMAAPREHPWSIEVPRDEYPVAAIAFIRAQHLNGNMLTFFDWGQQVIWELPDNPVSFDGRLDTVYSPEIMEAHWALSAGQRITPALHLERARVALLPTESGGIDLLRAAGWKLLYRDPLASVLVPGRAASPGHAADIPPVFLGAPAVSGRVLFPNAPPALADPRRRANR